MTKHEFQAVIRHANQGTALRQSFASPDTARMWARLGDRAGAVVAHVRRHSDGVVIYDPVNGVDFPIHRWYSDVPREA